MRVLLALLLTAAIGGCNNYGTVNTQSPSDQPPPADTADAGAPVTPDGPVAQNDGGSGAQDAAVVADASQPTDDAGPTDGGCPLDAGDDPDPKVTLCHLPPGNPLNCHTLHVGSQNAADAHLRHGDYLGDCRVGCR